MSPRSSSPRCICRRGFLSFTRMGSTDVTPSSRSAAGEPERGGRIRAPATIHCRSLARVPVSQTSNWRMSCHAARLRTSQNCCLPGHLYPRRQSCLSSHHWPSRPSPTRHLNSLRLSPHSSRQSCQSPHHWHARPSPTRHLNSLRLSRPRQRCRQSRRGHQSRRRHQSHRRHLRSQTFLRPHCRQCPRRRPLRPMRFHPSRPTQLHPCHHWPPRDRQLR